MDEGKIYKIVCPHCQKEQHVCKSMFRKMGKEASIGICLYCQEVMILVYNQEDGTMVAGKWERLEKSSDEQQEEEKYTIEQILDVIEQVGEDIVVAITYNDRDMLEDMLRDFMKSNK